MRCSVIGPARNAVLGCNDTGSAQRAPGAPVGRAAPASPVRSAEDFRSPQAVARWVRAQLR